MPVLAQLVERLTVVVYWLNSKNRINRAVVGSIPTDRIKEIIIMNKHYYYFMKILFSTLTMMGYDQPRAQYKKNLYCYINYLRWTDSVKANVNRNIR